MQQKTALKAFQIGFDSGKKLKKFQLQISLKLMFGKMCEVAAADLTRAVNSFLKSETLISCKPSVGKVSHEFLTFATLRAAAEVPCTSSPLPFPLLLQARAIKTMGNTKNKTLKPN